MRLRRPLPAVQGDTLHIVGVGDNRIGKVSTSAIEAMQARCITFIADVISEQKETYFRCFPRICLREGREFVDWIKDIEAEIRGYPFDDISRLADLRGEVFYKTVLKDMSQEDLRR